MQIILDYETKSALRAPAVGIGIFRNDGTNCYGTNTQIEHIPVTLGRRGTVTCRISKNLLLPGQYSLDVAIHTEDGFAYDYWRKALTFRVFSNLTEAGVARLEHTWDFRAKA